MGKEYKIKGRVEFEIRETWYEGAEIRVLAEDEDEALKLAESELSELYEDGWRWHNGFEITHIEESPAQAEYRFMKQIGAPTLPGFAL